MSYYSYGAKMSYSDYLTARSFVSDINSTARSAGNSVAMEVSRQTRNIIASNEALARDHIRVMEAATDRMTDAFGNIAGDMNEGFDRLSYGLEEISAGISELNATFHWGFGQVIAVLGHMNDALSELIKRSPRPRYRPLHLTILR